MSFYVRKYNIDYLLEGSTKNESHPHLLLCHLTRGHYTPFSPISPCLTPSPSSLQVDGQKGLKGLKGLKGV